MTLRKPLFVCTLVLLLAACKKNQNNPNGPIKSNPDVYVCGINGDSVVYWKNGVINSLAHGATGGYAFSIFVPDTNVLVAGSIFANSSARACSWKNGVLTSLADTLSYATTNAFSIYGAGNDVYVAGQDYLGDDGDAPVIWKNGVETRLSPAGESGVANSVFVSGSDVYVAGCISPPNSSAQHAVYWR